MTRSHLVRPTPLTTVAVIISLATIAWSLGFLLSRYAQLPDLLPVHFGPHGTPNGWQYKTLWRVLLPVFVQSALALILGAIGTLLLSRPQGVDDEAAPDVRAASTAAEAVALLTTIWVLFQGYGAVALVLMWQRGRELGPAYGYLEMLGIVLTIVVSIRAHVRLGRPEARPFIAAHWRFGQLYKNADDPALFVPTRQGSRWTLNFGRPVAAALLGIVLALGIVCPAIILGLLLR